MGYTPAVAACAAALLAPATFARRGSSGSLCRTDQNAGELEPASCPDGVAQPRSLCPTLSPAQPRSAPLVVPSDNYRFHSLAETYSSDNSDCTYSASRLCMKYNLGVPCPKTGLWMWIDAGQGLTGDHGPITDMLAEKYLGDKSLTLTVPEGQQGVLQGRCTGEGVVGCTQLGARIDLISASLHMSHIAIAGQSAIAQPTYTLSFPGHQSGGAICESAPAVGRTRPRDCCCQQTSMRARSGPSTACSITTTPVTRAARSWRTLPSRSRSRTAPSPTIMSTTSPEVTCARAAPSTSI